MIFFLKFIDVDLNIIIEFKSNPFCNKYNLIHEKINPLDFVYKFFFSFCIENTSKRQHFIILSQMFVLTFHKIIKIFNCYIN